MVLSRSQANEQSRVEVDPKPGTEGADGVEWLDKAERNRSTYYIRRFHRGAGRGVCSLHLKMWLLHAWFV